ncbi:MAG: hypothetical protein ABWX96_20690, partial [Propionibacteriaceae bacterium]
LPEALGRTRTGDLPGLLVPTGDSEALATALRRWLTDEPLRASLREAAQERRAALPGWDSPTRRIAQVLLEAADAEEGPVPDAGSDGRRSRDPARRA